MSTNNNQILPNANIWSHFIAGRLNPPANLMPMIPPNWMFPYLPLNKQQQFESLPNPYSVEAIQMFRSMLNRRNEIQQNAMQQNILPKNSSVPALFGLQKSVDFFLTRSPGSSNITSPIDQGFTSVIESSTNFDNVDGQKSDINWTRCPVCSQSIAEFEMESHLHQEMGALVQNSRAYKEDSNCKQSPNTPPKTNENDLKFDITTISNPHSQMSHQTSLNRYKNFEKIKFNRHQRKNKPTSFSTPTLMVHQNSLNDSSCDRNSYFPRTIGTKQHKSNSSFDVAISAKKMKLSDYSDEIIDMK